MSAFKVGDEVLVRGTFLGSGDSEVTRIAIRGGMKPDGAWWMPTEALEPATRATRAPWDVLREAADVFRADANYGAEWMALHLADRLETTARPPSLLEAAKQALSYLEASDLAAAASSKSTDTVPRLRAAIAAAEREGGQ